MGTQESVLPQRFNILNGYTFVAPCDVIKIINCSPR